MLAVRRFSFPWSIKFNLKGKEITITDRIKYSILIKVKQLTIIYPECPVVPTLSLPSGEVWISHQKMLLLISVCSLNKWRLQSYGNNLALGLQETENRAKWRTSFLLRPVICFYYLLGKTPHLSMSNPSQNDSCPHVNQLMRCMVQN